MRTKVPLAKEVISSLFGRQIPSKVTVVEVGPRDGLQNEKKIVPTATKVELINRLSQCGLKTIEATSFVSPKWVPQMADSTDVMREIQRRANVKYSVLVPNLKGLEAALKCQVGEIAVFGAVSESFTRKNLNSTKAESLANFRKITQAALRAKLTVRGYVSCVVGCPYEGYMQPESVAKVTEELMEMGCYQVSLGDTIGVGTPGTIGAMLTAVSKVVPVDHLALHCHDTYGMALANILTSLSFGLTTVDSSVGGLGGCPYAQGASGNVATEELIYMLEGMGVQTGVDLTALLDVAEWISGQLGRQNTSKIALALKAKKTTQC